MHTCNAHRGLPRGKNAWEVEHRCSQHNILCSLRKDERGSSTCSNRCSLASSFKRKELRQDSWLVVLLRIVHTVLCFWNHNLPNLYSLLYHVNYSRHAGIDIDEIYQILHAPRKQMLINRYKYNTLERADLAGGEVCAVGSRRARPYGVASQAK